MTQIKLIKLDSESAGDMEGQKRHYLPYLIKWTCPNCGKENERDLANYDYLSHPLLEKPFIEWFECWDDDGCEKSFKAVLFLSQTLSIINFEGKEVNNE